MAKRIAWKVKELAEMTGMSYSTVMRRIKDPIDPLPVRRFGESGDYLIFAEDYRKWQLRQPSNI